MTIDQSILKFEEKVVFSLRSLYLKYGYRQFKMSKFEEYSLYSKNQDFLVSEGVITFNDTNGKLMALKPDVTLSIIKNVKDIKGVTDKFYYNETVYRISETTHTYKEVMQTGLECIGDIGTKDVFEVAELAVKSLEAINSNYMLHISHIGLINSLLCEYGIGDALKGDVITAITEKNTGGLKKLLSKDNFEKLRCLTDNYDTTDDMFKALKEASKSEDSNLAIEELEAVCDYLASKGYNKVTLDFSISKNDRYYSGIIFKGFINGFSSHILSGGQYDKLMKRMNRTSGAIGFAVYLDSLENIEKATQNDGYINIALPKGRLGEKVYDMFEKAGFDCPSIKEENRKLIFENHEKGLRFFWVKPSDVAIYVERGTADIGVAGKDILLEYSPDVFELLDLNIGKCNMAVATKNDFKDDTSKTLKVATKFTNIAKDFYAKKCRDIDIIKLNGSIEIAPILGLSDVIVDIVETGKTLLENNLTPVEMIVPISARLISNKASYGFKTQKIESIVSGLAKEVKYDD